MTRQPFNDFLNSSGAGPSTPRGRGRGGYRGGRGGPPGSGGRGGRGGGAGGGGGGGGPWSGGKASFKADYTNMPFNYDAINNQKYNKMEGFSVQPFGPSSGPSGSNTPSGRGRGGYTPGGARGDTYASRRGRASHLNNDTPSRSGIATPVHGVGFHDDSPHTAQKGKHAHGHGGLGSNHVRSTVGKGIGTGDVTWGGGKAPLFVKAGELFKDGEVDIITMDKDHHIHVEALPLSDPSAPQMTDLRDDREIDIMDQSQSFSPESEPLQNAQEQVAELEALSDVGQDPAAVTIEEEEVFTSQSAVASDDVETTSRMEQLTVNIGPPIETHAGLDDDEQTAALDAIPIDDEATITGEEQLVDDAPMFYIDTEPALEIDEQVPTYEAVTALPLGSDRPRAPSPDEEILFVPRSFTQPEPISVPVPSITRPISPPSPEPVSRAFVNPRALSRAEKKAAKREKRRGKRGGKNRKHEAANPRDDSDIEWGSDGPPPVILDVEGAVALDVMEEGDDVRILRDYMAGTLLNARQEAEDDQETDEDGEEAEEIDIEAMRRFGAGIKGLTETGEMIIDSDDSEDEDEDEDEDAVNGEEHAEDEDEVDGQWVSDDSQASGDLEDSDEGSSSDLGDLEGILDIDDGEEEDRVDVNELFNGRSQWKNETDWFIDTLESALDGGAVDMGDRKNRNKLFKSIENGDFGDVWGLEPVKKGKKKNKHVPAELQAQWEADRQRKAEKKRQRELERLIAEIDLSRSSFGRKGKGKGKANSNLAQQAALAHLIPASASKVAEMFDISSDDEMDLDSALGSVRFRKGGLIPSLSVSLIQVDEKIQLFLDDKEKNSLSLPPMDKEGRKKVHLLAECYGLKSKSRGGGKTRFTVLIKTKHSGRQVDYKRIERLLSASTQSGGGSYKALYSNGKPNKFASSSGGKGKGRSMPGGGASGRAREGELVGEGAEKIGGDNVGHRLLSKMGWAEGDRIGKAGGVGLDAPIIAIVKNTKAGLGA